MVNKQKVMLPVLAVLLVLFAMCSGAWADATKILYSGNPSGAIPSDYMASTGVEVATDVNAGAPLGTSVRIIENSSGDLVVGSIIQLTAPDGLVFDTRANFLPEVAVKQVVGNAQSTMRLSDGTSNALGNTAAGDAVAATAFNASGNVMTLTVFTAAGSTSYIEVGNIAFATTSATRSALTNTADLKMKVYSQAKGGDPAELGDIDLLARPRIISAVKVDNTHTDLTFNVSVSAATAASAGAFFIDPGSGTVAAPTAAAASTAGVRLTHAAWTSGGMPTVKLNPAAAAQIQNYSNVGVTAGSLAGSSTYTQANDKGYAPVLVKTTSSDAITTVAIDNENAFTALTGGIVGLQNEPGASNYPMNTFDVTFTGTAGTPIKFKIVPKTGSSHGSKGPLDTADLSCQISGVNVVKESSANYPMAVTSLPGSNGDIFVITGTQNTGAVTARVVLGAVDAGHGFSAAGDTSGGYTAGAAIAAGDEIPVIVVASMDNFETSVNSGYVTVDAKSPTVSTATAMSRKSVKLVFNEAMDASTLGQAALWNIRDITNGANITVASVAVDADGKTVTLEATGNFPAAGNIQVETANNLAVLASVEDAAGNMAHTGLVARTATWTPLTANIATPAGNLASVTSAAGGVAGNTGISNGLAVAVTVAGDSGLTLNNIHLQVVDASDHTKAQSPVVSMGTLGGTETTTGIYTANMNNLYASLSSDSVVVRSIVAVTAPASETSWAAALYSNELEVDNTIPTVVGANYNEEDNEVTMHFSVPMNATALNAAANFRVVSTVGDSVDVLNIISVASDKKSITFSLLQSLDQEVTWNADVVNAAVVTDNGVAIQAAVNTVGIDMANITTSTSMVLDQSAVALEVGGASGTVTISGGTPTYAIESESDQTVVEAVLSDSTLTLNPLAEGTSVITIKDSSSPVPQQQQVTVTVGDAAPEVLNIVASPTSPENGDTITLTITNGETPFTVTADPAASVSGLPSEATSETTLTVTAVNDTTEDVVVTFTVTDSADTPATDTTTVTITGQEEEVEFPVEEGVGIVQVDSPTDAAGVAATPMGVTDVTDDLEVSGTLEITANIPNYDENVDVYFLIADGNGNVFCAQGPDNLVDTDKLADYNTVVTPYAANLDSALAATMVSSTEIGSEGTPAGDWALIWAVAPANGGDNMAMWDGDIAWGWYMINAKASE